MKRRHFPPPSAVTFIHHSISSMFRLAPRYLWTVDCPLRGAIVNGDLSALGTVIAGGANFDLPVRFDGMTPLMWAIRGGHVAAAVCLIHHRARLHVPGTLGNFSALYSAVYYGHTYLVFLLLQPGVGGGADNAVDVNAVDVHHRSPLFAAALHDRVDAAVLLLETHHHWCDVDLADAYGCTPLHEAAGAGRLEFVRILLSHGASLDLQNLEDETASDLAARHNHLDVVWAIEMERRRRRDHGFQRAVVM